MDNSLDILKKEKGLKMRKTPIITIILGAVLLCLFQERSQFMGTIGLFIFIFSVPFFAIEVNRYSKKQIIDEISNDLTKLDFTQSEIEVRQKGLKDKSKWELKSIRRDVKAEIKEKERKEFLKK